jgi:hypothetical protein
MNNKFCRGAIGLCLGALVGAHAWVAMASVEVKPKYGPSARPVATTLSASHGYFQSLQNAAPDYWALAGYYVHQINGAACSAASITMVLNAARAGLPKTSETELLQQSGLLEKTLVENWRERLSPEGFGMLKARGVTLAALRNIAEVAFRANGFPNATVTITHVADSSAKTVAETRQALLKNEKSSENFIIANFDQKVFTDDAEVGHVAPVAAYDAQKKRVLIFDPDRQWYEPYWVSEQAFIDGMRTKDSESGKNRGYITIQLGPR